MKNLIGLSTLAIAIAAIGVPSIPSVAQAQEVQYDPSALGLVNDLGKFLSSFKPMMKVPVPCSLFSTEYLM
ncbi:hypothetical protein [Chlorogloeopsis sp. ULAP02]|uniref:hypothetical protein n=1 Tax=Chlorogloeopsis sp. ULAP02 TaxID=3107926 RepID=UPI00398B9CA4